MPEPENIVTALYSKHHKIINSKLAKRNFTGIDWNSDIVRKKTGGVV